MIAYNSHYKYPKRWVRSVAHMTYKGTKWKLILIVMIGIKAAALIQQKKQNVLFFSVSYTDLFDPRQSPLLLLT